MEARPQAVGFERDDRSATTTRRPPARRSGVCREVAPGRAVVAARRNRPSDRAGKIGVRAGEIVGRRLDRMPSPWTVVHDVPLGGRTLKVDHLAIGPGGVFTVDMQRFPHGRVWITEDQVRVNGFRTDHLDALRWETHEVGLRLAVACGFDVAVQAVSVVIAEQLTIGSRPAGVTFIAPRSAVRWLQSRPPVLSLDAVAAVQQAARQPSTWR